LDIPEPPLGEPFQVPEIMSQACKDAVEAGRSASVAVQQGRRELGRLLEDAIKRIDQMAGLRAEHHTLPPASKPEA